MEFNGLDPIGNEERPRNPFRKDRLRRGIYILPSIFTVANLLCGYYAVLATLDGKVSDFDHAAGAIGHATADGMGARTSLHDLLQPGAGIAAKFQGLRCSCAAYSLKSILIWQWSIFKASAAR